MVSEDKLREVIDFFPHEKQELILLSKNRDIVICAGRRFGKSSICAYMALKLLLQDDKKIWIVAPTYDLAQKVFEYLARWWIMVNPDGGGNVSFRPFPRIITPWNSRVECKSTENPQGLLGEELDLLIVDEASQIQRGIWETYLYPTT